MQSLQNEIDLLQTAYTSYQQKQSKVTGTNLRKALMNVSKGVGVARKEILQTMKDSVVHKPKKNPPNTPESADGDLGDDEVVEDHIQVVVDEVVKPVVKKTRKSKKA